MMRAPDNRLMDQGLRIVLTLLALGISVIFHEQMHARVAWWLGDPTGKNDNRLSWNPIHHVDPFLTFILPLVLYFSSRGQFVFGGAKPVMINPMNFKNPGLGMCLSAAAGPLSNFFLALLGFGLCVGLVHTFPTSILSDSGLTWNGYFLVTFVILNVVLGAFNILPLPGLDGSRIFRYFLPRHLQAVMDSIEPIALFVTMILVFFGAAKILSPVFILVGLAFHMAAGPDFMDALMLTFRR
jgi:Zn-dependent protease